MKSFFTVFFLLSIILFSNNNYALSKADYVPQNEIIKNSYVFIENKGQWDNSIRFAARTPDCNIIVSDYGIKFDYFQLENSTTEDSDGKVLKGQVVSFDFIDNNPIAKASGIDEALPYYNYFKGSDPSKWASHCRTFRNLTINNIYSGIDIKLFFVDSRLRYDFVVHPNADVSALKLKIDGANGTFVTENGLSFDTRFGKISHGELFAFQNSEGSVKSVNCKFIQKDGVFSFNFGNYIKDKELIIDPIVFSTYWGGSSGDEIVDIKNMKYGEFVVLGWTESGDFKTTPGAYDENIKADKDIFISKFELYESHNNLIFSTIVGSNGADIPTALALDVDNDIYFIGSTNSSSYPALNGFSSSYQYETDCVLGKLSSDGSTLLYSSIFGGKKFDYANGIVVGSDKTVYICGCTNSTDFPTKAGCYQVKLAGLYDAFLLKVSSSGKVMSFSTYMGGSGDDKAYALDVDLEGGVYLTGETNSGDLPMAPYSVWGPTVIDHPYDYSYNGGKDAFVAKIGSEGSRLEICTYFGGSSDDIGRAILVDADLTIWFAGETLKEPGTQKFPTTDNTFSKTHKGGYDCFFGKMDKVRTSGTPPWTAHTQNLLFSSLFGGSSDDKLGAMVRDPSTNTIFMTGRTNSSNFPIINSTGTKQSGKNDLFLVKFLSTGSDIVLSTLLGGKGDDWGNNLTIDSRNDIYVAGYTASNDNKLINCQIQSTLGGVSDGFIAKFAVGELKLLSPMGNEQLCPNSSYDIKWATTDFGATDSFKIEISRKSEQDWKLVAQNITGNLYHWVIPDKYPPANDYIMRISNKSGIFSVSDLTFSVCEQPSITGIDASPQNLSLCEGDQLTLTAHASGKDLKYQWFFNDNQIGEAGDSILIFPNIVKSGIFKLVLNGYCLPTITSNDINVTVNPQTKVISLAKDTVVKKGKDISFTVKAKGLNLSYEWYFGGLKILSANDSIYTITGAGITLRGNYKCVVKGLCGEDSSYKFFLDVDTSTVISVKEIKEDFQLYSVNISNDLAQLKISSNGDYILNVSLYNVFGQKITELNNFSVFEGQNSFELPLKNIPQGFYWIVADNTRIKVVNKILIIK